MYTAALRLSAWHAYVRGRAGRSVQERLAVLATPDVGRLSVHWRRMLT